jgi:hypothetical protein
MVLTPAAAGNETVNVEYFHTMWKKKCICGNDNANQREHNFTASVSLIRKLVFLWTSGQHALLNKWLYIPVHASIHSQLKFPYKILHTEYLLF